MTTRKAKVQQLALQCKHCRAPQISIFDMHNPAFPDSKYIIDTKDFKVTRLFSKDIEAKSESKTKLKKTKAIRLKTGGGSVANLETSNPLTIDWSGTTFMTEYENFVIDLNYEKNKMIATEGRQKWNEIKKKLKITTFGEKVINAGPEWFQDLSPYQMEWTDNLPQLLHRDCQESKSSRSQEYLFEIGIEPPLPQKIVTAMVNACEGDPMAFLFKCHEALVRIESEQYGKSYWEAKCAKKTISPFSINERILLTCAFHIYYPKLLEKLDKILPPEKPKPRVLWAKKPKKEKKKRYASPYLEPLPLNDKPWYEERLEEELQKLVELEVKRQRARDEKEEFDKKIAEQKRIAEKEKEQKEIKRQEILRKKKKMKALEQQKLKRIKAVPEEDFEDFDLTFSENVEGLPSRERKSEFFKHLNPASSLYQQSLTNKSKEFIKKEEDEKSSINQNNDGYFVFIQDPALWIQMIGSDGCTQTPFRGIGRDTMYAAYVQNEDLPKEGVSEPKTIDLRKAPFGCLEDDWTQTAFTKEFPPLKKAMRDFLLKQRGIQKQLEKFYNAAMHKRGIFGPPTNYSCRTSCLQDLEWMAINREITILKAPSHYGEDDSDEESKAFKKYKIPNDISLKELTSVKRFHHALGYLDSSQLERKMSGPPFPSLPEMRTHDAIPESTSETVLESISAPAHNEPEKFQFQHTNESLKPIVVECKDSRCQLVPQNELPIDEFSLARKRIALIPMTEQLAVCILKYFNIIIPLAIVDMRIIPKVAIQYLCEKGDPLAVLPNIDKVPWLARWFDKRNGIRRELTEKDKRELMEKSVSFWGADYVSCKSAPVPIFPKKTYDWHHKKWLLAHLDKLVHEHRRKVKHILIDNARDLFPTMFCEYFNTPLNRSFRKLFYTYFPSCERDLQVSRPWDPYDESKPEGKLNSER